MLTQKNLGYAGGAEIQQVHLGRELVTKGYDVCFVTYRHGHNQIENASGIKIITTYDRNKADQISVLSKYVSVWASLKKAEADIYFHSAGSPGVLPLFCCVNGKKFVYRIPSDAVVLSKPLSGNYSFNRKIVDIVEIKRADVVIAQSNFQQRILKERFKVECVVIKNGLLLPHVDREKPDPPTVLWVGSISNAKNPHLFVELAKLIPNVRFEMVGGKTRDRQLYEKIKRAAKKISNFKFHGFVPYHEINEYFKRASIFVNTSSIEGFPNTFIQAWAHYTPVLSLNVDPDGIIQGNKLGFYSGTFKQLVSDVNRLLRDEDLRKEMGNNGRNYVEEEHNLQKIISKYINTFEQMMRK